MTENINSERKERTYLITRRLCEKIHYAEGTINNWVSAGKLVEGVHFIKPNGKNRLWIWEAMEEWIHRKYHEPKGSNGKRLDIQTRLGMPENLEPESTESR